MSLADLLLTRDAAAAAHDTAQEAYQLHGGGSGRYQEFLKTRGARTKAQDAVDAASAVPA